MSKIGDTRPGKSTPSYGSSKTPPSLRPGYTSRIEEQTVGETPIPEHSYTVIQNSGDNSLGSSSKIIRPVAKTTPMPKDSYTIIQRSGDNSLGGSSKIIRQVGKTTSMPKDSYTVIQKSGDNSLGGVSKTIRQVKKQTPMPEDSYTVIRPKTQNLTGSSSGSVSETTTKDAQETPRQESEDIAARIQDLQDLKDKNGFIRKITREHLVFLNQMIKKIPTKDQEISEARDNLLQMIDLNATNFIHNLKKKDEKKKLISLVDSGEETLEKLKQTLLKKRSSSTQKNSQIDIIKNIMKETCDFIQCFNLSKMKKELDKSKTYDDLVKMRNDLREQGLKRFFIDKLNGSILAIGKYPDKDAKAAELINILQQIPDLTRYIPASRQASSSNVMREQEAGTSRE